VVGGWWGLGAGLLVTLLTMGLTKSFGIPYLWPLVPFDGPALLRVLFRYPIPQVAVRPRLTQPQDLRAQKRDRPRR